MKDDMKKEEMLLQRLLGQGYGLEEARATADDLLHFGAYYRADLNAALELWCRKPSIRPCVTEGPYSTDQLMAEHGLTYPAALLTLDWIRTDPEEALACLTSGE